jgi:hypothetical protein
VALEDEKKVSEEKEKQATSQKQINTEKEKGIDLDKVATDLAARLTGETRSYLTELKDILKIKSRLSEDDKALVSISKKLMESAEENNTLLRRSGQLGSRILKDKRALVNIDREINVLLATNREFSEQIYLDAVEMQKIQKELLDLDEKIAKLTLKKGENYYENLKILQDEQANLENQLIYLNKTNSGEVKKLSLLLASKKTGIDIVKNREEELKFGHEVNKNLGLTGALLDNLDKLGVRFLGGIGLNLGVFNEAIEEGKQKMQEVAETYTLLGKKQKELSDLKLKLQTDETKEKIKELTGELSTLGIRIAESLKGDDLKNYNTLLEQQEDLRSEQVRIQEELNQKLELLTRPKINLNPDQAEQLNQEIDKLENSLTNIQNSISTNSTEMEKFGLSVAEANTGLSGMTIKFRSMKEALPGIRKAFLEALFDPLTPALIGLKLAGGLINLMTKNFGDLDKATVEFRRLTGESSSVLAGMNDRLATSVDVYEVMSALTKEIGTNAMAIFGPAELGALAEAKNLLGLSVEQTSMLGLLAKSSGTTIDGFQDSFSAAAQQANALGDSAIPASIAFGDILNTSKDISLSLGNNPQALAKAGVAARALGVDLKKLDNIASSLLDFESSIEAELEAQLLTGKAINLAKAREFALNNDLAGLAGELAKNGASAAEFANMNRLQQESIAKALGMSREELANSIIAQDTLNQLTEQEKANIRGVTLAQSESMTIQEEINKSLEKLAQAFLPIVQAITPLVTALTPLVTGLAQAVSYALSLFDVFTKTTERSKVFAGVVKAIGVTLGTLGAIRGGIKLTTWIMSATAAVLRFTTSIATGQGILRSLGTTTSGPLIAGLTKAKTEMMLAAAAAKQMETSTRNTAIASQTIKPAFPGASVGRGAGGRFTSMKTPGVVSTGAGKSGSLATGVATTGAAKLLGKGLLRFIPYVGWALLALDALKMIGNQFNQIEDGVINPEGGLVVSGPKGSIQLDKQDSIIAGTDLAGGTQPAGINPTPVTVSPTIDTRSFQETNTLLKELISVVRQGGNVYMDGNKVGQAIVLAGTKSS